IPDLSETLGSVWRKLTVSGDFSRRTDRRLKPPLQDASAMEELAKRTFRITIKMFMDAHTFHEARLRQCCVHTGTFEKDPRRYSFCWRWLFADATDSPQPMIPLEAVRT